MTFKTVDHSRRTATYRSSVSTGIQSVAMFIMTILGIGAVITVTCVVLAKSMTPVENLPFYTSDSFTVADLINLCIAYGQFVIDNWVEAVKTAVLIAIVAPIAWTLCRPSGA